MNFNELVEAVDADQDSATTAYALYFSAKVAERLTGAREGDFNSDEYELILQKVRALIVCVQMRKSNGMSEEDFSGMEDQQITAAFLELRIGRSAEIKSLREQLAVLQAGATRAPLSDSQQLEPGNIALMLLNQVKSILEAKRVAREARVGVTHTSLADLMAELTLVKSELKAVRAENMTLQLRANLAESVEADLVPRLAAASLPSGCTLFEGGRQGRPSSVLSTSVSSSPVSGAKH